MIMNTGSATGNRNPENGKLGDPWIRKPRFTPGLADGEVFRRLVAELFLETGGEIGRTGEAGFKCDFRNIVVALPE